MSLRLLIGVALVTCVVVAVDRSTESAKPPLLEMVRAGHRPSDAVLLDRHGSELQVLRVDKQRRRLPWVTLADVSPALIDAVLAVEDRRFRQHGGVDILALAGALRDRLLHGTSRGASTLSMQLATLLDTTVPQSGQRSPADKWRQMRRAWVLERQWTKDEILEAYLNLVTFRGEQQGVAAAAVALFDKLPHGLSAAEATALAASVRSPNAGADSLLRRSERLSRRLGWGVPRGALAQAVTQICAAPLGSGPRTALAPHLARQLLSASTNSSRSVASTLDASVQTVAIRSLQDHLRGLRERSVEDGAVLVADNRSGEVLAYVGSSGPLSRAPQVDGVQARRQAGSALKPFLYALALEQQLLTAASILEDTPFELAAGNGLYRPENYDGRFRGLVTVRSALAGSLNLPAVRTLQLVGNEVFVQHLRRLGFSSVERSGEFYGPSLALGSADVTLWELVTAYRVLAAGGIAVPLRVTPGMPSLGESIYSEDTAFLLASILSDREGRSLTFGLEGPLSTPYWTAVKTGTSKEMRDNWCIGYSQHYTVGVWVGNATGLPMRDVSGVAGAAPVWRTLMDHLHRDRGSVAPAAPAGIRTRQVSFDGNVEPARNEWFRERTELNGANQLRRAARRRILSPVDGTIVALDPDIGPDHQRIALEAEGSETARWRIDGIDAGPSRGIHLWTPSPGRHRIELIEGGQIHDEVELLVRGPRS